MLRETQSPQARAIAEIRPMTAKAACAPVSHAVESSESLLSGVAVGARFSSMPAKIHAMRMKTGGDSGNM